MATLTAPPIIEVYLCDPTGFRVQSLDYVTEYEYALLANEPGPFRMKLPSIFNNNNKKMRPDMIVEIWRGHGPGTLKLEYCGFVRSWSMFYEGPVRYTEIGGFSSMEILRRRIVKDYSGSAQAKMTNFPGDMIKAICKDQLGGDTTIDRDLTLVGGGVTIQGDVNYGTSLTREFEYKNVLEICVDIANTSKQTGTEIYFDVAPTVSVLSDKIKFQVKTWKDQRGSDRTWDSSQPVFIGTAYGNLENGRMDWDYGDEINCAYVLGPGDGASREIAEVSDPPRKDSSIWNRREGSKDARNVEAGNVAGLQSEGKSFLAENRRKIRFSGDIVETTGFRYGKDFKFGDKVTVVFNGIEMDANINKVFVSKTGNGQEIIRARLELEL